MKLYLDLCVYNRPFDYQGQERVALETSAFIYILEKIENAAYTLVTSEALIFENNKNTDEQRKMRVASYFQLAKEFKNIDGSDMERVNALKRFRFSDVDALHIALAEKSGADYFITCDDEILKSYKQYKASINIDVVNIMEFIALEEV